VLRSANALRGREAQVRLSDQNSDDDALTYAAVLVFARTGDAAFRQSAAKAIGASIGTERGGRTLALARNLAMFVIAADLIDLRHADPATDARFRAFLGAVRTEKLGGRTLVSTHEERPNNWGTMAGGSRIAADLYLGDRADLARAALVFQGWTGDRGAFARFKFGSADWQCDRRAPVGINPAGCGKLDGALPEEMRRAGGLTFPPPKENYAWGGLQGAVVQAGLLQRAGFGAFGFSRGAIGRALTWLYTAAKFPPAGNDAWIPWVVNKATGARFATTAAKSPGNIMAFTDWTHAG
jgi:hypothetical protein